MVLAGVSRFDHHPSRIRSPAAIKSAAAAGRVAEIRGAVFAIVAVDGVVYAFACGGITRIVGALAKVITVHRLVHTSSRVDVGVVRFAPVSRAGKTIIT